MLRLTVELVPTGDSDRARTIGHGVIGRVGDGMYVAGFADDRGDNRVAQVAHVQDDGLWTLLAKALFAAGTDPALIHLDEHRALVERHLQESRGHA